MRKSVATNLSDTLAHLQKAKANYTRQRMGTGTIAHIASSVIEHIERADREAA